MTALLLITHGDLGASMLRQARHVLGDSNIEARTLGVEAEDNPELLLQRAAQICTDLDQDVVVLTDIYGATPSNIAHRLRPLRPVVHGVNLAMLLRAHCYATLDADEMARSLVSGGRHAIFSGDSPPRREDA